ncbi:hypothetical protein HGA13_24640 [Nocardia speluncae]|uniref:Uncharacterized protein n=1 Tax=Nocardia speluncae TaxID=419477 RepID=A0A846XJQ1_9NOCA|nr:hypothetical protein [Nocardia speluncae]NKY36232.1 hypothetical protein [Nocardia speluncae]
MLTRFESGLPGFEPSLPGFEPSLPGSQILDVGTQLGLPGFEPSLAGPQILDVGMQTAELPHNRVMVAIDPSSKNPDRFRFPIALVDYLHNLGFQDSQAVLDRHLR